MRCENFMLKTRQQFLGSLKKKSVHEPNLCLFLFVVVGCLFFLYKKKANYNYSNLLLLNINLCKDCIGLNLKYFGKKSKALFSM